MTRSRLWENGRSPKRPSSVSSEAEGESSSGGIEKVFVDSELETVAPLSASLSTPEDSTSATGPAHSEAEASVPEDVLRNWFPATREGFTLRCGEVKTLEAADLADEHRRRHLESFRRSMQEWEHFGEGRGSGGAASPEEVNLFLSDLLALKPKTAAEADAACQSLRRKHKVFPTKAQLVKAYDQLFAGDSKTCAVAVPCESSAIPQDIAEAGAGASVEKKEGPPLHERDSVFASVLRRKAVRTNSGVAVVTVLTSPGKFSCPHDCHYCPQEPGQPRSYLSTEPAVLRANQNDWDPVRQFNDRASTLRRNGHVVDKVEVLVLGGTWSSYPAAYQEEFVRDIFYAANVFGQPDPIREALSLEEEQRINEEADCRIVGLTLETRPDFVTRHELRRLRRFGCTRVQLGIQHVEDRILDFVNRGCHRHHAIKAIRMLKDAAFKVDIHLMPDLPSSDPESDRRMFYYVLSTPDLQADQWKIYPCEVTPFSTIERWYHEGRFIPYAERDGGSELIRVVVSAKAAVHPWIRLNRVVRDIPNPSVIGGNAVTNLRQELAKEMKNRKLSCKCIRCREVGDGVLDLAAVQLRVREYASNGGTELFLSFETKDAATIFGFLRLRLRGPRSPRDCPFSCLQSAALLRELHVYGSLVAHGESKHSGDTRPQHAGLGRRLIQAAEVIALSRGFRRMAVIAGVGTRQYYRQSGYCLQDTYMVKQLSEEALHFAGLSSTPPSELLIEKQDLRLAASAVCLSLPPPCPPPKLARGSRGHGKRTTRNAERFDQHKNSSLKASQHTDAADQVARYECSLRETERLAAAFRVSAVKAVEKLDVKKVLASLRTSELKEEEVAVGPWKDTDSFAEACAEFKALEEQRKSREAQRDSGREELTSEEFSSSVNYWSSSLSELARHWTSTSVAVAALCFVAFCFFRSSKTRLNWR